MKVMELAEKKSKITSRTIDFLKSRAIIVQLLSNKCPIIVQ